MTGDVTSEQSGKSGGDAMGAAGASGFIDAMGYVGATLAGWGAGRLIESHGYQITFVTFGSAAFLAALLACIIWKVRPQSDGANSTTES